MFFKIIISFTQPRHRVGENEMRRPTCSLSIAATTLLDG